jgi:hypothetical protein
MPACRAHGIRIRSLITNAARDEAPFPIYFREGFVVAAMIVTPVGPISAQIGGLEVADAKARPTLASGRPVPDPDGTVSADDIQDFPAKDGS